MSVLKTHPREQQHPKHQAFQSLPPEIAFKRKPIFDLTCNTGFKRLTAGTILLTSLSRKKRINLFNWSVLAPNFPPPLG